MIKTRTLASENGVSLLSRLRETSCDRLMGLTEFDREGNFGRSLVFASSRSTTTMSHAHVAFVVKNQGPGTCDSLIKCKDEPHLVSFPSSLHHLGSSLWRTRSIMLTTTPSRDFSRVTNSVRPTSPIGIPIVILWEALFRIPSNWLG